MVILLLYLYIPTKLRATQTQEPDVIVSSDLAQYLVPDEQMCFGMNEGRYSCLSHPHTYASPFLISKQPPLICLNKLFLIGKFS